MRWPAGVIAVALLGAARVTAAQPSMADAAVADAEARAKASDFLGAAARYRDAYKADPRPALVCNIGIAYFKAKTELPRAQLFLSRCSERGAFDAKFGEQLRAVLGVVDSGLRAGDFTPVDIAVEPPTANVAIDAFAPDETFLGSRLVWLPRGTHHVTATADGFVARTVTVEATAKDRVALRIVLDRTPPPTEPVAPAPQQPPPPQPPPPAKQYREETTRRSMIPAIAASAGTVLFVAGAIYAKGRAQDGADRAPFAITHDAYQQDKEQIDSWNTRMSISGALAVLCAGATGYLWYRALNSTTQKIEVTASDHSASLSITRRF